MVLGFPGISAGKESACNAGDTDSIPGEGIGYWLQYSWTSPVAQRVKNMPAVSETWVPSLGWEDPPEEGMATLSSILAWRIPWTEEPGGLQSMVLQRVGHDWSTKHNSQHNKCSIRSEYLTYWIWKRRWKSFSEIFLWLMFRKPWFSFICFKIKNLKM